MCMPSFKVQWDEKSSTAKNPTRKSSVISAANALEAKAKIKQRAPMSVKITNITAVKLG